MNIRNNHSFTSISNVFNFDQFHVGNATYGALYVMTDGMDAKLLIGHFCSIASDVKFVLQKVLIMSLLNKITTRIKEYGLLYVLKAIFENKVLRHIDNAVLCLIKIIFKNKPLKNIIVFESQDDFDCNGGPLFEYLQKNDFYLKYSFVWMLHNGKPKKSVRSTKCFGINKPSIFKSYNLFFAKYFFTDNAYDFKCRNDQIHILLGHGVGGLKNVSKLIGIPDSIDYILLQSEKYAPIQAKAYNLEFPNDRFLYLGYPAHDYLNQKWKSEINKIVEHKFSKIVLWMPTFRKGGGTWRNDSDKCYPLGVPLFYSIKQFKALNSKLRKINCFLIIKIHPAQFETDLRIYDMSNIIVLTKRKMKSLGLNIYKLMTCVDAMISDYSGAAFEFLQVNKPIAYDFSDADSYKPGFVVDDISKLIAGNRICSVKDFLAFIESVVCEVDEYSEKRNELRKLIYKFSDSDNCKRIVEHFKL